MEENLAIKEYLLVCRGYCPEVGCVDHALKPINDFKCKQGAQFDRPAQNAITLFERLATRELPVAIDKYPCSRFSLVRACLLTGRKHQLRRHFKHLSHPIIGCPRYGKSVYNHYFAAHLGVARLLLHASRLSIDHPMTGQPLLMLAPPQGPFAGLLQHFEWGAVVSDLWTRPLVRPAIPECVA
jgi:tRNA pseudouridine65 synthase